MDGRERLRGRMAMTHLDAVDGLTDAYSWNRLVLRALAKIYNISTYIYKNI
jgi:hypothetical protein